MLNDADNLRSAAGEKVADAEALFAKLKRPVTADYNSKGQVNWRREARADLDFEIRKQRYYWRHSSTS